MLKCISNITGTCIYTDKVMDMTSESENKSVSQYDFSDVIFLFCKTFANFGDFGDKTL